MFNHVTTLVVNIIDTVGLMHQTLGLVYGRHFWNWYLLVSMACQICSNAGDVPIENEVHLVGGLEQFLFFHILGIIIQLTNIFQRG
jgi:hypothetical protein